MPRNQAPQKPPADSVLAAMMATHWAIQPEALETMVAIAERTNLDLAQLERQRGEELKNAYSVTVRDAVATLPVTGPLFRYASFFSRVSGATSYEDVARDFTAAIEDPRVKAIVLAINSPGGSVDGNVELTDMVAAARGSKPIVAYVSHLGASAAYLLASAADEIVIDPTAMLGSIGTVATVRKNETNPKSIEVVSTQSPMKRPDPESPAGRASIQRTVDALAQVFVERVAANRGVSVDTVLADFGQGDVFVGQAAVDAGLADRIGSYESVLAELVAAPSAARPSVFTAPRRSVAAASTPRNEETRMAKEEQKAGDGAGAPPAKDAEKVAAPGTPGAPVAAAAPAVVPTGLTEAQVDARVEQLFTARMKAEGDRVAGIKALAKKGNEKMIEQCIADASCSVNDAKARLYDHDAALAKAKLDALKTDELKGGKPSSAATPAEGELDARAEGRAMGARVRAMLKPPTPSAASGSSTPTA